MFQTAIAEQDQAAITGAVIAVIIVFVMCGSIVLCYNKRWACFKVGGEYNADQGEDSPMKEMVKASEFTAIDLNGAETDTKDKDTEVATNEQNGTDGLEAPIEKKHLADRFASFFRFSRKELASKENQGTLELGLNGSKCSENGTVENGGQNQTDKENSEQANGTADQNGGTDEKEDKKTIDEEDATTKKGKQFATFLSLFKRGSNQRNSENQAEDTEEQQGLNRDDEQPKENESNENEPEQVEFEPETKPAEDNCKEKTTEQANDERECKPSGSPKTTPV